MWVGCARSNAEPDVVLFVVDTLRADRLHSYGFPSETSPHIDALAELGIVFEQAQAPAPRTLPSVASLFTSRFVFEHNVVAPGEVLSPEIETLAERLDRAGYISASLFHNAWVGPRSGLSRGFQTSRLMGRQIRGQDVAEWLSEQPRGPFFLYVHNTEPHDPPLARDRFVRSFGAVTPETRAEVARTTTLYRRLARIGFANQRPPGTTDNTRSQQVLMERLVDLKPSIEALYAGAVKDADARVGEVVAALRAAGRWENTLFILLSDHGEELGDHEGWLHDQSVYEELIRVPLILRLPGNAHAGLRIRTPVSLVDILPTVLDFLGRSDLLGDVSGQSLLPLIREPGAGPELEPRVVAGRHNRQKFFRPYKEGRGDLNLVVRLGQWKGIWNVEPDTFELYDLAADPGERNDLTSTQPERSQALRSFAESRLRELRDGAVAASTEAPSSLDAATRANLEALGYLSTSPAP
jgi:arylsulfatase A-like enzyme